MPIYAYRCDNCGFEKDVLQKMSDAKLTTCPKCKAETFTKQLTAAGFQLKGNGWYATDFKNPPSKSGKTTDSGSSSTAANTSDTATTPSAPNAAAGITGSSAPAAT